MQTARRSWGGAAILALAIALALTVSGSAPARGPAARGHRGEVHLKGRVAARDAHAGSFVVATRRHHRRARVTVHAGHVPALGSKVTVRGRRLEDGTIEASSVREHEDASQQGDTQTSGGDQGDTPDQQQADDQGDAPETEQGDDSGDAGSSNESGDDNATTSGQDG